MSQKTYAVSEIVSLIKATIEQTPQLQQVAMIGELSNVTISANNHWYFTLKDSKARLSCVMFSRSASRIKTPFKEGDQVIVLGRISMYEASGALQCYVSDIQLSGLGNLYAQLERTRKKLAEEGIFDDSLKQLIPIYPMKIGLISSDQSAAYFDVVSTLSRRWPLAKVLFKHTQVQGVEAIEQIKAALTLMDNQEVDVMLLVRGGGSIEDLWCFNDESVVRLISTLKTPIISGVGHESDITLVDYVVDKRAPTPTGAAELATPSIDDVRYALASAYDSLTSRMQYKLEKAQKNLEVLVEHRFFKDPLTLTSKFKNDLVLFRNRLEHSISSYLAHQQTNEYLKQSLLRSMDNYLRKHKQQLAYLSQYTKSLSLDRALARGFSITRVNDTILSSVKGIKEDVSLHTTLSDGVIISSVTKIKETKDE
jgi:exodeoxyribonuclease VII large subunit